MARSVPRRGSESLLPDALDDARARAESVLSAAGLTLVSSLLLGALVGAAAALVGGHGARGGDFGGSAAVLALLCCVSLAASCAAAAASAAPSGARAARRAAAEKRGAPERREAPLPPFRAPPLAPPATGLAEWVAGAVGLEHLHNLRAALGEDGFDDNGDGWELAVEKSDERVTYAARRRKVPGANGLSEWRATAVFKGVSAEALHAFYHDEQNRASSDPSTYDGFAFAARDAGGSAALLWWRVLLPRPFAPREYAYVKRVWASPDGCTYSLSRHCTTPPGFERPAPRSQRANRAARPVLAYYNGCRIRPVEGGAELKTVYHDDLGLAPHLVDVAVASTLWGTVKTMAANLSTYTVSPSSTAGGGFVPAECPAAISLDGGAGPLTSTRRKRILGIPLPRVLSGPRRRGWKRAVAKRVAKRVAAAALVVLVGEKRSPFPH